MRVQAARLQGWTMTITVTTQPASRLCELHCCWARGVCDCLVLLAQCYLRYKSHYTDVCLHRFCSHCFLLSATTAVAFML